MHSISRPVLAFAALAVVTAFAGCAGPGAGSAGVTHAPPLPFTATGNEPGWRVDLGESRLTVLADYGATRLEAAVPAPQIDASAARYATRIDGQQVELLVRARRCSDTMTGMPYPHEATLVLGERRLSGCGGDPRTLLVGAPWALHDPDGPDAAPVLLRFDADGRLLGEGACHVLRGSYTLTGEGLQLEPGAEPLGSCDAAHTGRERRLLERLTGVYRFSRPEDGTLLLHAGDGVLDARR